MLAAQLTSPSATELKDFLASYLYSACHLVQIAGLCQVSYLGRALTTTDAGDGLVIVKQDGSLQVHGKSGYKPRNWQPRAEALHIEIEEAWVVLTAERTRPREIVRVTLIEPALVQALTFAHEGGFTLSGSEADMRDALQRHPDLIETGLSVLDAELPTEAGGIDLYARDGGGNYVVVELKRGKASHEAVQQLKRYVDVVAPIAPGPVRGILAAPAITRPAMASLGKLGLEFREITALPDLQEITATQPALFGSGS